MQDTMVLTSVFEFDTHLFTDLTHFYLSSYRDLCVPMFHVSLG